MQHYEIKGNLFSAESLDNLTAKPGQNATDFGLASGTRLSDEIAHTFTMVRNQWTNFQYLCQRLDAKKTGVSETRNQWVVPMLDWLGYKLQYAGSKQIEGKTFAVSHQRSEEHTSELQSPDHLVCRLLLEKKNKPKRVLTDNTFKITA